MKKIARVDTMKCVGCEACVYVCPVGVLEVVDMKCRVKDGCIGCGACVDLCNWKAITLVDEPTKKGEFKRDEAPLQ